MALSNIYSSSTISFLTTLTTFLPQPYKVSSLSPDLQNFLPTYGDLPRSGATTLQDFLEPWLALYHGGHFWLPCSPISPHVDGGSSGAKKWYGANSAWDLGTPPRVYMASLHDLSPKTWEL